LLPSISVRLLTKVMGRGIQSLPRKYLSLANTVSRNEKNIKDHQSQQYFHGPLALLLGHPSQHWDFVHQDYSIKTLPA
jgi:hypothetical protein